jgi:hypothetical protein
LKEEYRLRVSENRVLRRIFGPKREEDGSWRKLHDDEFIKTRRMMWWDMRHAWGGEGGESRR